MQNYKQPGDVLSLPAPYAVESGGGAKVGQLFGVAAGKYANGETGEFLTEGVFELPKLSAQAWTVGALVYWADGAKQCTTVATGNLLIGCAVAAAANPSATGLVRLNGVASANAT